MRYRKTTQTLFVDDLLDKVCERSVLDVLEHEALVVEVEHDAHQADDARVTQSLVNRCFALHVPRHTVRNNGSKRFLVY